jgi:hypothetical protein
MGKNSGPTPHAGKRDAGPCPNPAKAMQGTSQLVTFLDATGADEHRARRATGPPF